MTDDILDRTKAFLTQCGPCEAGLPSNCACVRGDYRPVMLDLVREVERLRNEARFHVPSGGCPRCGDRLPLGGFGICDPCAALMGWAPECGACLADQQGQPFGGLTHLGTCADGRMEATR